MVFWQLTIDANDPARLARFWAQALGWQPAPSEGDATWWAHYRRRLGEDTAFDDRIFEPWIEKSTKAAFDTITGTPTVKINGVVFKGDLYTAGPLTEAVTAAKGRP